MSQLSKQNYDVQCSDSRAKKSYYQILVPVVFYIYVVMWCSVPEINNGLCRYDEMKMVFFNFFPFWMIYSLSFFYTGDFTDMIMTENNYEKKKINFKNL